MDYRPALYPIVMVAGWSPVQAACPALATFLVSMLALPWERVSDIDPSAVLCFVLFGVYASRA
eukprot:6197657-Pleurochrysis_carterae.AAC.1